MACIFAVSTCALPSVAPGQDMLEQTIPIQPEQLQGIKGHRNDLSLVVRANMQQSIDEFSSYVVATRFVSILALQDAFVGIPSKPMVWKTPYNLVQIEITPIEAPRIMPILFMDIIIESLIWLSQHSFVQAEFTLVEDHIRLMKAVFNPLHPSNAVATESAFVTAHQNLEAGLAPTVDITYKEGGAMFSPFEVFMVVLAFLQKVAILNKDASMHACTFGVDISGATEAYVQVRGVGTRSEPEQGCTVLGIITAMWKMPIWLLGNNRLAEVKGVINNEGGPKCEVLLLKGTRPADAETPKTS